MTAPVLPPVQATTKVRQDQQGNVVVVLRIFCGPVAAEVFIGPDDAATFGEGLSNALRTAGEQAQTLKPNLIVPPKGLLIPKANGGRP